MSTNTLPNSKAFIPQARRLISLTPLNELWAENFKDWIAEQSSPNTQRAYRRAWIAFRKDTGLRPLEADTPDFISWVKNMKDAGITPATIHLRLAAISSFYNHTIRTGLCRTNPIDPVPRPCREPYHRARALDPDQARALLCAIPRCTLQGKRDYALILMILVTGRPVGEICQIRFGDL